MTVMTERTNACPRAGHRKEGAAVNASAFATPNSIDTCGTTRSAGHRAVPKQASAARESGHRPKCVLPRTRLGLWTGHSAPARARSWDTG
ncbi:hypothetical protein GCM10010260_54240 [Streptomyces filipinensis]|uniref:Uncharacterized protein n=1 Tax=Streptomyces filipinensis TaxID=66887 RepID=A0A918MDX7_9ACTN|nr:hypothetical protein GCM10010260_54240 [Streptomyces filipinensis]